MQVESIGNTEQGAKKHLVTLEVNPPRGADFAPVFDRLDGNLEGIDFLNITDSALARMRCAPLPFAATLKQRYGVEALVNISCRDRNLIAIQGDLLAGWALGVRSIVALTGDAVTIGDSPDRKGVFEVNSIGLLHVVEALNGGKDISGNELKGAPQYYPGVVVNPNAKNVGAEIRRLQKKKDAGARYALSQPVFDIENAVHFLTQAQSVDMPILLGLLPFKSAEGLQSMNNIPGIKISEALLEQSKVIAPDKVSAFSIDFCLKVVDATQNLVRGFHVVSGTTPKLAIDLARELATVCK